MNIVTRCIYPPIPTRSFDWIAYEEGNEEGTVAYGATEQEAVDELQDLQETMDSVTEMEDEQRDTA